MMLIGEYEKKEFVYYLSAPKFKNCSECLFIHTRNLIQMSILASDSASGVRKLIKVPLNIQITNPLASEIDLTGHLIPGIEF